MRLFVLTQMLLLLFEVLFLCCCWFHRSDAAVWSTEAQERCLANYANTSLVAKCTVRPVFYGSYQERLLYRKCELLKCEFIASGCVSGNADPPPSLACYSILGKMSRVEANCPYRPCEGYNSKSQCVKDDSVCQEGQGEVQWFGLCKGQDRCCLLKKKTSN